jgi:hypothetical protein
MPRNWFAERVKKNISDFYNAPRRFWKPVGDRALNNVGNFLGTPGRIGTEVRNRMFSNIRDTAGQVGNAVLGADRMALGGLRSAGNAVLGANRMAVQGVRNAAGLLGNVGTAAGEAAFPAPTFLGPTPQPQPVPVAAPQAQIPVPINPHAGVAAVPPPGSYMAEGPAGAMWGDPSYGEASGNAAPMSKILNDERLAAFNRQPGQFIGSPSFRGDTMSPGQRTFMRERGLANSNIEETPAMTRTRFLGQMPARTVNEQRAKVAAMAQAQQGDITAGQQAGLAREGMASQERIAQSQAAGMAGKAQRDADMKKYVADMHVKAAQLSQSNTVPPRVKEAAKMVSDAIKEGSDVNPLAQGIVDDYLQQGGQESQQDSGGISNDDEQALAWASENLHSPGNSIKAQQIMANLEKKYGTKIKAIKPKA